MFCFPFSQNRKKGKQNTKKIKFDMKSVLITFDQSSLCANYRTVG